MTAETLLINDPLHDVNATQTDIIDGTYTVINRTLCIIDGTYTVINRTLCITTE